MMRHLLYLAPITLAMSGGTLQAEDKKAEAEAKPEPVSYYRQIRPIFQAECHGCHQPAKAKGGYVMTDFEQMLKGGDSEEPAIVPKSPDDSYLMELITPIDGEAEMPQKADPLPEEQVALIARWIAEGAVNDIPDNAKERYDANNPPVYKLPPVVTSMDFSPDGQLLAVAGFHEVLLHQADGSGLVARLIGLSARIESVRFSPDGKKLAVTGGLPARMGEVQIWDVAKRKLDLSVPVTFDTIYGASWSPDSKLVAFGCSDTTLRAINAKTGEQVLYMGSHNDWILDTVFSSNGTHVVSVGRDQTVKLSEVKTERFIDNITSITPGALKGGIYSVSRHPYRDEVLVGGADGTPQIFRLFRKTARKIGDNANLIRKLNQMPGRVFAVAYSADGKRAVTGSSLDGKGTIHTYITDYDNAFDKGVNDIMTKKPESRNAGERKKMEDFLSRGIRRLASISTDGGVFAVDFHPSGNYVATSGSDGIIRLMDAETGSLIKAFLPAPVEGMDPNRIIALGVEPQVLSFNNPYDYAQMLVVGWTADGNGIDLTRTAKLKAEGDLLDVSKSGMVRPKKNGTTRLMAEHGGKQTVLDVTVANVDKAFVPNFVVDVAPVISRLGCNAGTCHGAKDGKNGFKLSLRGYDPLYDVRAFSDDLGSRRISFASPDDSLMLLKATAGVPHEGGQRMKPGDNYYKIIRDWIAAGCELKTDVPRVKSISLSPINPVVQEIGDAQQMRVIATFADGRRQDVTAEAFLDSGNTEVAVTKDPGLVTSIRRGEAPLLARYEGAYAATTLTVMGDRSGFEWKEPPVNNQVDQFTAAKWKRMKILPSDLCTDAEFVRRIYLDLTGLPPTIEQVTAFLADKKPSREKRDALIDKLVGSEDYVDYWSNKWSDLLQVNRKFLGKEGAASFRQWIRNEVKENRPYDEFVRSIVTASGSNKENPPASYYKILRTPTEIMENTTHLFLATRFNCNKCHDHPFERWTQDQYYEMAAHFAQVGLKRDPASGDKRIGGTAVEGAKPLYEEVYDKDSGEVTHDRTGQITAPDFPYKVNYKKPEKTKTRRQELASWITSSDNQYFAMSYVNRVWGYLTGTGIIEPLDDIRAGNPPSNPELLNWLTDQFVESGFDVQSLIRTICKSRTYQLSIKTHQWNEDDAVNFSHGKPRRLPAEVLYDAIYRTLGAKSKIPGVPEGTRAAALPDVGVKLPDGFLGTLGRPPRESACECERSNDIQLGSIMALVTGPTVENAVSDKDNAVAKLAASTEDDKELIRNLYLRILSRPATDKEVDSLAPVFGDVEKDHQKLLKDLADYRKKLEPVRAEMASKRDAAIKTAKTAVTAYEKEIAPREAELDRKQKEAIAAAEKDLKDLEATLPKQLADWEKSPDKKTRWVALDPKTLAATMGTQLAVQDEGAIFASGATGQGSYHLQADAPFSGVTGIKIEALADKKLPKNGPGRFDKDGNFVLTELDLQWARFAQPDKETLVQEWSFKEDTAGWKNLADVELSVKDKALHIKSTGKDPHFETQLEGPRGDLILEFRVRSDRSDIVELFWTSKRFKEFDAKRSARVSVVGRGQGWTTHRIYFKSRAELTSLRLDPGTDKGEWVLDGLRLLEGSRPAAMKLELHNAKATYSQKGYDVKTAIDGKRPDKDNGWALSNQLGRDQSAVFELKKPLEAGGAAQLMVELNQNYNSKSHMLGKFRVLVTQSKAPLDFGLPRHIGSLLEIAADQRTEEQTKTLLAYVRGRNGDFKKKEDKIKEVKKPRPEDPKLTKLKATLARVSKPLPADPKLTDLEKAEKLSAAQLEKRRLTAAQDLAWGLINNPSFLFNR